MKKKQKYMVVLWEFERGWGSKPFHATLHNTLAKAEMEVMRVNGQNTAAVVPDYYIIARLVTEPEEMKQYKKLL